MLKLPEFQNSLLRRQAVTHSSYANEHPGTEHNERLEFLGDATLKFHLSRLVYHRYPHLREGGMTVLRAEQEKNATLAKVAAKLGLGKELRLGNGTKEQGGRDNQKILSGAFEAVIGAYLLDSGDEAVQRYVESLLPELLGC
jgi:ribonuclease III